MKSPILRHGRTIWIVTALLITVSILGAGCAHDSNEPPPCNETSPNYPACLDA